MVDDPKPTVTDGLKQAFQTVSSKLTRVWRNPRRFSVGDGGSAQLPRAADQQAESIITAESSAMALEFDSHPSNGPTSGTDRESLENKKPSHAV